MSSFQPWLNKQLPESVQSFKKNDANWPSRCNIIVGDPYTDVSLNILCFMGIDRSKGTPEEPAYTVYLPHTLQDFAAAAATWRLLAGVFLSNPSRPAAVTLEPPSGEDPDVLNNTRFFLSLSNDGPFRISFAHFLQLYAFANCITPPPVSPYAPTWTETPRGRLLHPARPPKMDEVIYSRYIIQIRSHFQLNAVIQDMPQHLAGHPELQAACSTPSGMLVIGEHVGDRKRDVATFVLEWSKEASLAGSSEADDYDRDVHLLQFAEDFDMHTWLVSLCHYLFTADVRTRRINLYGAEQQSSAPEVFKNVGFTPQARSVSGLTHNRARPQQGALVLTSSTFWATCPF